MHAVMFCISDRQKKRLSFCEYATNYSMFSTDCPHVLLFVCFLVRQCKYETFHIYNVYELQYISPVFILVGYSCLLKAQKQFKAWADAYSLGLSQLGLTDDVISSYLPFSQS